MRVMCCAHSHGTDGSGVVCAAVLAMVLHGSLIARGHEVDHFTPPPPRPFADLGPFFTAMVHERLTVALEQVNGQIAARIKAGDSREEVQRLQSPDELAQAVVRQFGIAGIYIQDLEVLVTAPGLRAQYPGLTVAHRPTPCIYDRAILPVDPRQFYLLWRSSIIMIDGVYVGTDKIGHFIHHGYNYYREYRQALGAGASEIAARRRAAALGCGDHFFFSERRLLGTLTSGVVSNADLASNYLGLLFYINLTEPVRLRGVVRPPMCVRDGEYWALSPDVTPHTDFFVVFFSPHWDEALNPNLYDPLTADAVRKVIRPYCAALGRWYADENGQPRPAGYFRALADELRTYYGEDYGHTGVSSGLVAIATVCDCEPADGNEPPVDDLHIAANRGELHAVRRLIARGADINAVDAIQRTPLHWAVRRGDLAAVRLLRDNGADLDARDADGETALHMAARGGDAALVAVLLESGADVDARACYQMTPLHVAVQHGRVAVAELLLRHRALVDAQDEFGCSALHDAAAAGHPQLVALLVAAGADPNLADARGETPWRIAARNGHAALLQHLLRMGVGPGASGVRAQSRPGPVVVTENRELANTK